jgi:hypothetical protein
LAVIAGKLRFMSRPVTEDLAAGRESMIRCLSQPIDAICPGHREPLTSNVAAECERMMKYLRAGSLWPLFG